MNQRSYDREQQIALDAVRTAAGLCQTVQRQLEPGVLEKDDRSPVTVADFGSQALICRALKEAFPDDPIIGEEDAGMLREPENEALLEQVVSHVQRTHPDADAETVCRWIDAGGADSYHRRFWTLDPIDGTKGFLRGVQYAIALALVVGGKVQVAVLACPNLPGQLDAPEGEVPNGEGCIYTAIRDQGAEHHPLEGSETTPIEVSALSETSGAQFCESVESRHTSHGAAAETAEELGITAPPVRVDSQAKYAIVARGDADIYLRLPRGEYIENIWDHAAGALVVREAGGTVTDMAGKPLEFHHGPRLEENRGIIVTNGRIHEEVLAALDAVGVA